MYRNHDSLNLSGEASNLPRMARRMGSFGASLVAGALQQSKEALFSRLLKVKQLCQEKLRYQMILAESCTRLA